MVEYEWSRASVLVETAGLDGSVRILLAHFREEIEHLSSTVCVSTVCVSTVCVSTVCVSTVCVSTVCVSTVCVQIRAYLQQAPYLWCWVWVLGSGVMLWFVLGGRVVRVECGEYGEYRLGRGVRAT
jgi:hypothetical protein